MHPASLTPDESLMEQIFPDRPCVITTILSQDPGECSFLISYIEPDSNINPQTQAVVRLSMLIDESLHLPAISAMSTIAALAIPELVPVVYKVGTARTYGGKTVEFSVTEFIPDATTLEKVWDNLSSNQQQAIAVEVVAAVSRFQNLSVTDPRVQNVLSSFKAFEPESGENTATLAPQLIVGGPCLGFHIAIAGLLQNIVDSESKSSAPPSTIDTDGNEGVVIKTIYPDIPPIHLMRDALEGLQSRAVLCHNDLEPRNLMVRQSTINGKLNYHLVSIIDWEQAAVVPFGYEYILKDQYLGSSNQQYGWYALFKTLAGRLQSLEYQVPFMLAVDAVYEAYHRYTDRNVGILVRRKWIEREQLVSEPDAWRGWVRKEGADVGKFGAEDNDKLVQEVLAELRIL